MALTYEIQKSAPKTPNSAPGPDFSPKYPAAGTHFSTVFAKISKKVLHIQKIVIPLQCTIKLIHIERAKNKPRKCYLKAQQKRYKKYEQHSEKVSSDSWPHCGRNNLCISSSRSAEPEPCQRKSPRCRNRRGRTLCHLFYRERAGPRRRRSPEDDHHR